MYKSLFRPCKLSTSDITVKYDDYAFTCLVLTIDGSGNIKEVNSVDPEDIKFLHDWQKHISDHPGDGFLSQSATKYAFLVWSDIFYNTITYSSVRE